MALPIKKFYGDSEGPLGLPMRSEDAAALDALLKTLPKEVREKGLMRVSTIPKSVDLNEDERADISFVTTDAVDRDYEVVLPGGADWKQFKKNPVVTFAHKYDEPPVGRSMWVKRDQKGNVDGWLAKTAYIKRPDGWEGQWFPDAIWHFIKEKAMPGKSIGFIPLNFRAPDEKEIIKRPELAKCRGVIDKWLALEYAVTPVQSNPDALVQSISRAKSAGLMIGKEEMERLDLILPEDPITFDELDLNITQDDVDKAKDTPPPASPTLPDPTKCVVVTASQFKGAMHEAMLKTLSTLDPASIVRRGLDRARGRI